MDAKPTLMIRLSGLLFWFDESLQASLARAGFEPATRTQSLFLLCVGLGERRPSRLAALLGVSRQAVSHIINDLSKRGLITLAVDPADARGRIVEYARDAQDFRRAAHAVVSGLEALLEDRIGAEAFRNLQASLSADWGEVAVLGVAPAQADARDGRWVLQEKSAAE